MMLFECLEMRRFLSVTLGGQVLRIVATTSADVIYIQILQVDFSGISKVNVSQHQEDWGTFDLPDVSHIVVRLKAGADHFLMGGGVLDGEAWPGVRLYAGNGNDTIRSGAGDDEIYGQRGHDGIDAGDGNDTVSGQVGVDYVSGGAGNDLVIGGRGNDVLDDLTEIDGADDADGDDTLRGGSGDDVLYYIPKDDDLLFGGPGEDEILKALFPIVN